jgi:hypothetical protein
MRQSLERENAPTIGNRQKRIGDAGDRTNYKPFGTNISLFAYADAVAAVIPGLPRNIRPSAIQHLLAVLHAALAPRRKP